MTSYGSIIRATGVVAEPFAVPLISIHVKNKGSDDMLEERSVQCSDMHIEQLLFHI